MCSNTAGAHSSGTGAAAFYEGALSVYVVPGLLLALIGFGLILGLQKLTAEHAWQAFALAGLAGLGAVYLGLDIADPELPLIVLAMVAGLFVASGLPLPLVAAVLGGATLGFLVGVITFPHPGTFGSMALTALGGLISANVLLFYVAAIVTYVVGKFKLEWVVIGLRVAGSWIAAISFIVLALYLSIPMTDEMIETDDSGVEGGATTGADQE